MLECGPDDLVIALMGMTGAGKSSFISLLVGQAVVVGHQLQSCTQDISVHSFVYDGGTSPKRVFLVDSPGFDDDTRTDSEILRALIAWLTEAATQKITLSGIIYLHRINQPRLQGSAKKNIRQFEKLCGDGALAKVILVTTMWDIEDPEVAVERERQLRETKEFWGYMMQKGSKMYRHSNTRESALEPIRHFIKDDSKMVLEVVTEAMKPLTAAETDALLDRRLAEERAAFQATLASIRMEFQKALKQKDEEVAEVVQQLRQEQQVRIDLLQKHLDDLRGELTRKAEDMHLASLGSKRTNSTPLSHSGASIPKRRPVGTPSGSQVSNMLHNPGPPGPDETSTPPDGASVETQLTPNPEAKQDLAGLYGSTPPPDSASPSAQTPADPLAAPLPPSSTSPTGTTTEAPTNPSSSPGHTQSATATRPSPNTTLSSSLSLYKLPLSSTSDIPAQPQYVLTSILAHNSPVTSLAFSPDNNRLGAAAATEVHIWTVGPDPSQQPQLQHTIQHTGPVSSLSFSSDGLRLASGVRSPAGGGGALLLCAPSNPGGDAESYATEAAVAAVAWAPDAGEGAGAAPRLAVAAATSVLVWNTAARAFEDHLSHTGVVSALAYCPRDGRRLAVVQGAAGEVVLWGRGLGGWAFERVLAHGGGAVICCVAFAPDGKRIAAGAADGTVLLWSVDSGGVLERSLLHEVAVGAVAFTPDGEKVVAGLMDGSIRVSALDTGVLLQTLCWHKGPVLAVAISSDGFLLASGSMDKMVCFGRLQGGIAVT